MKVLRHIFGVFAAVSLALGLSVCAYASDDPGTLTVVRGEAPVVPGAEPDLTLDGDTLVLSNGGGGSSDTLSVDRIIASPFAMDMQSSMRRAAARAASETLGIAVAGSNQFIWSTITQITTGGHVGIQYVTGSWPGNGYLMIQTKDSPTGAPTERLRHNITYNGTSVGDLTGWKFVTYTPSVTFVNGVDAAKLTLEGELLDGEHWKFVFGTSAPTKVLYERLGGYMHFTTKDVNDWYGWATGTTTDGEGWYVLAYFDPIEEIYIYQDEDASTKQIGLSHKNPPLGQYFWDASSYTTQANHRKTAYKITNGYCSDWAGDILGSTTYTKETIDLGCYSLGGSLNRGVLSNLDYMHVTVKTHSGCITNKTIRVPPAYRITYDSHGGSSVTSSDLIFTGYSRNVTDAVPTRDGYTFQGWYSEANGQGTKYAAGTAITLTADKTLHAHWKENPKYKIETSKDGEGTITATINNIAKGENKTISYSPSSGYYTASVTVDGTAVNLSTYPSSYTFSNISANHTVHVVFKPYYQIRTMKQGEGTITESIGSIKEGETKTVSYSPASGWYLYEVKVDNSQVSVTDFPSSYTFSNIQADHDCGVKFLPYLKIDTAKEGEGTITASISNIKHGENKTVSYSPASGWYLDSLMVDGTAVNVSTYPSSYTFSDMDENHTVKAVFKPLLKITTSKHGEGTITASETGMKHGSNRTVSWQAGTGWYVDSVIIDGSEDTSVRGQASGSYEFRNMTSDHTVRVIFKPYYTYEVDIKWRLVDGSFTEVQTVHEERYRQDEDIPTINWERNKWRPESENVYEDATEVMSSNMHAYVDPNSNASYSYQGNIRKSFTVERKKYTYTFDPNPPEGYVVIGNVQDNLVDRWAESLSGTVKSPTLPGYTFLGWNTKKDGTGQAYVSEQMLSNKTFYARWRKNKYQICYHANGSYDPDRQTGESGNSNVLGVMANTEHEFDTRGRLRMNAFTRTGYEFLGWNTKADGTGTAYGASPYDLTKLYSDGYANVWNMTEADGAVLDLYAIWRRVPGDHILTIVSEETGNPVSGVTATLLKQVNGTWMEVSGIGTKTTDANGQICVDDLGWFAYEWRIDSVPAGYERVSIGTAGVVPFTVAYNQLHPRDTEILYMKHCALNLISRVSEVISGEGMPAFLYQVDGMDVAGVGHRYTVLVPIDEGRNSGWQLTQGLYAGTYRITQLPVSRYVPQQAENHLACTVDGINATAYLVDAAAGEVEFPYVISQYEGFGSVDHADNGFQAVMIARIRLFRELFLP